MQAGLKNPSRAPAIAANNTGALWRSQEVELWAELWGLHILAKMVLIVLVCMSDAHRKNPKAGDEAAAADAYTQYKEDRHEAYLARRNSLNDFAFKTSERYDQWVLTLSGGALAISLTFLEKIAPEPARCTLILLGLSWLAYIGAVLVGFSAIHCSRHALYRELEIGDEVYAQFRKTSTQEEPEGDQLPEQENRVTKTLNHLNTASVACVVAGTLFMCFFALVNISIAKPKKGIPATQQITVQVQLPQISTNSAASTNTNTLSTNKIGASTNINLEP
jgi:hypothetical protein